MTVFEVLGLSLLGGALTVEGTAVGQFMLSRPLIAGALTGWAVGAPAEGFAVGMLLEVYLLVAFPVGGARFPEGAPATVVAASVATLDGGATLGLGVAVGLVWGQLSGLAASAGRTFNGWLVAGGRTGVRAAEGRHLLAIVIDFLRGAVVTGTGVVFGVGVGRIFGGGWPLGPEDTWSLLLLGGLVSVGILLRSFGGVPRRAGLVGGGLLVGAALGWLT